MILEQQVDKLLLSQLAPVVRRDRRQRLLAGWAAIAGVSAVLAILLRLIEQQRGWDARITWVILCLGTAAAALWWRRRLHQPADDLQRAEARRAARLLEQADPELRALLLTAVAQAPVGPDGQLGYLQEQLVRQALGRVDPERWPRVVPARRLYALGGAAGAGVAVLLACAAGAFVPELPTLWTDAYGLEVSPGDTQGEQGTNVLVLARFRRRLPSGAVLVVRSDDKPLTRLEMRRTLQDPVWGTLTPALGGKRVEYFVEYDGRRSPRYRIAVFRTPEVERLDAKVEYPKQPMLPAREVTDLRHLSVQEGARVTLTVRLAGPAREVRLSGEGESLRLAPASGAAGKVFWGVVQPQRTRRYDVGVTDEDGRRNPTPPRLTIEVHRNQPPQIKLSFPGKDIRVSPLEELNVEARIEDDVAVLGHGFTYRLAGQPPQDHRLPLPKPGPTANSRAVVALEDLSAKPDQLLTYFFWAEDRDAAGKVRRVSSDMYFAEVRPFEERFREQASGGESEGEGEGAGGPLGELTEEEKKIINATWRLERDARDGRPTAEISKDIQVVATSQAALRKQAEKLRAEVRDPRAQAGLDAAGEAMGQVNQELQQAERAGSAGPVSALARALEAEQRAYSALLRLRDRERAVTRGRRGGRGAGGEEHNAELSGLELKQKDSRYETRKEAIAKPAGARPEREALGRLEELARRQKALSARLQEAEAARIKEASQSGAEAERQRRLKSLREEQKELMEELDQLARKLEQSGQSAAARRTRAELEATRREAAATSEALAQGETGKALGASTRAERELERMRKDLAREVASGFEDEMRELRDAARKLDETQQGIGQSLARNSAGPGAGSGVAESPTETRRLAAAARGQKADAERLLERLQKVSDQAEASAPLLSRKLYDGLREAKLTDVERSLDAAAELLDRNLTDEARAAEERARRSIGALRAQVDEAAKGVLGDQEKALRLAQAEIDSLLAQAAREGAGGPQAGGQPGAQPGRGNDDGKGQGQRDGDAQSPGSGQRPGQQASAGGESPGGQPGDQPGAPGQPGEQPGGQRGARGGGERGEREGPGQSGPEDPSSEGGGGGQEGPISGAGFRGFAERLRDVEDLLDDPRQRQSAAGVRDRARALRAEYKYYGKRPSAAVLEKQILAPLAELRRALGEDIARLSRNERLVPLDRDPVPGRYSDVVRRYWKSLSEGR